MPGFKKRLYFAFRRIQGASLFMGALFMSALFLSFFWPQSLNFIIIVNTFSGLFLGTMLISCFFLRKKIAAPPLRAKVFFQWIFEVGVSIFVLWLIWAAQTLAWIQDSPYHIRLQADLLPTMQAFQQHNALYPWWIIGFVSSAYVFLLQNIPNEAIPEGLVKPVFSGRLRTWATLMAGMMMSLSTQWILALSAVSLILLILQAVDFAYGFSSHLSLGIWLFPFLALLATLQRLVPWKNLSYQLGRKGVGFLGWTLALILFFVGILMLFKQWAFNELPSSLYFIPIDSIVLWKMNAHASPIERLNSLQYAWWLLWTPLIASYWARLGQKLPWYMVLSVSLFLPWLIQQSALPVLALGLVQQAAFQAGIRFFLIGILFSLFIFTLWKQNNARRFSQGFLLTPKSKIIKAQGLSKALPAWMTILSTLLMIHGVGGWYLIQAQITAPALLLSLCIAGVFLFILKVLSFRTYGSRSRH